MANKWIVPSYAQMKAVYKALGFEEWRARFAISEMLKVGEESKVEFIFLAEHMTLYGAIVANFAPAA